MKLQYNLLHEENISLISQLDTMSKQSKENMRLFEKHRKLKVEKQQDVAVQADLVCKCNVLYISYNYCKWAKFR